MNLATTDVERFQYAGTFINYLWEAPLETLAILVLGLDQVGVSFLAGFAALAFRTPASAASHKLTQTGPSRTTPSRIRWHSSQSHFPSGVRRH